MSRKAKRQTEPAIIDTHEPILWRLLSTRRPHLSKGIQECMAEIVKFAPPGADISRDKSDNLWIDARGKTGARTMFAAHLDTVERTGKEGSTRLFYDRAGWVDTDGMDILGADDGAGCALLVALMIAKVPALYFFSQGEECGGAAAKAAYDDPRLNGIDRCIAWDRKGTKDIVGDQARGIMASRAFVSALADAIGMGHSWALGSYTDSSEFSPKIKEIVNISVGYELAHSCKERLNYPYWIELRDACIKLDWEALPTIGPDQTIKKYNRHDNKGKWNQRNLEDWDPYLGWGDNYYGQPYGEQPALPMALHVQDLQPLRTIQPRVLDLACPTPWDTEATVLCRQLGFDPAIDDALMRSLSASMKYIYYKGVKAGQKEVYNLMTTMGQGRR